MLQRHLDGITDVERDLVNELHDIAAEHDRDNPPVNFPTKSLDFTRGHFDVIMSIRVSHIQICLIDIFIMRPLLMVSLLHPNLGFNGSLHRDESRTLLGEAADAPHYV